jgi:hypothetical protein
MKIRYFKQRTNQYVFEVDGVQCGYIEYYGKTKTQESESEIWFDDIDVVIVNKKGWTRKQLNDHVRYHFELRKKYPHYRYDVPFTYAELDGNGIQYVSWLNSVIFFKSEDDYIAAQFLI